VANDTRRRRLMAIPYPGNVPSNVKQDAKYKVKHGKSGRMEVTLVYRVNAREKELLTTDRHPDLVDMVNAVKIEHAGQPGGAFYINEYLDVIVPTPDGSMFAGQYEKPLEFELDGTTIIGPRPPASLLPGQLWPGPHVGIDYTMVATADDIRYERMVTTTRTREELLSDYVGTDKASALARRLSQEKGRRGGGIYINEAGEFFASVEKNGNWEYRYLGPLEDDAWFPPPDLPRL